MAISVFVHAALLFSLSRVIPFGPQPRVSAAPDMQIDLVTDGDQAGDGQSTSHETHLAKALRSAGNPLPASLERRNSALIKRPAPFVAQASVGAAIHGGAPAAQTAKAAASAPSGAGAQPRLSPPGPGTQDAEAVDGNGMRSMLRTTVGCSHVDFLRLTPAERAVCARQFGRQASIGARQTVDPVSMKKRDYFDAVRQAYDSMRNYPTPLDDDPEHSASGPGHGPSIGCIHGKCGVISPQGTLTEETGISPP